ncbi:unnamed protein product [Phytomonas sp. Hart1]|nr:unnamed protein product [Phytomonas sp. Hart1]|eukprot:CCW66893.1 unnamed protein product [Phytomonas sp. isolate Hart1]
MLHSFIVIPPDVYTTDLVDLTIETLRQADVCVDQVLSLTGEDAKHYGAHVQRHYTIVEHYAMSSSSNVLKEAICSIAEVHSMFFCHFHELWAQVVDEGRLLTARDALISLGCSEDELRDCLPLQSDLATKKLFRGCHVAILRESPLQGTHSKPIYVINGFFPSFLNSFNSPDCMCGILAVSWPQSLYSYAEFRTKVIGSNGIPVPVLECLKWSTLPYQNNLKSGGLCWDNVVRVASGPLEVLAWRRAWLDEDLVGSDLGCDLLQRGLSRTFLEKLLDNPVLLLPSGHLTSIFELFANPGSIEIFVERIQELHTRLRDEEEEEGQGNTADRAVFYNTVGIKEANSIRTSSGEAHDSLQLFDQHGNGPIFITRELTQAVDTAPRNTALLLVKPSAFTPRALSAIWECLLEHRITGLRIEEEDNIDASQIQAANLVDRHYRTIAYYTNDCTPHDIPLDPEALEMFERNYDISWENAVADGLVWFATNLLRFFTWITPCELFELWNAQPCKIKLTSGAHVSQLFIGPPNEGTCYFVVNGFYPYLRELFLSPGSMTKCYIISWPESVLSWSSFRKDVIGCTDPSKASPNSLRGMIYQDWKDLGLARRPSSTENGVHASASPLEAMIEQHLWLGTPLGQCGCSAFMLKRLGLSPAAWLSWALNPRVHIDGSPRRVHIFDLLENKNTHEFLLAALQEERQQLKHYDAEKVNRAVLVLHPSSASGSLGELVREILSRYHITVEEEGDVYGKGAAQRVLGMPTLQRMAHLASLQGVELLHRLTVSAKRRFYEVFHKDIDVCKDELLGAENACTKLGFSPLDLLHACTHAGLQRLSSHCQVSFLPTHQCFVINGVYPYLHEKYTASSGCRAHYFRVVWEECNCSWESFYDFVMGYSRKCSPNAAMGETGVGFVKSPTENPNLCEILCQALPEDEKNDLAMLGPEALWYLSTGPLQALSDALQWSSLDSTSDEHSEDKELRLLQDPMAQWLLMKGVSPYIVSHLGFLQASSTVIEQEMLEHISTGHDTSVCVQLTRSVARDLSHIATHHFAFLWLPPSIANSNFVDDIPSLLAAHGVRVLDHRKIYLCDATQKQLLERPYSAFYQNACQRSAIDMIITTAEADHFKRVFGIEWSTAVELSLVLNAKKAAALYGEDHILQCWDRSNLKVCLSPKLYVCYMEKEGLYVVNAHYLFERSRVLCSGSHAAWYSICWGVDRMNWDDFLSTVIGFDRNVRSSSNSLKAYLTLNWEGYGLSKPPDDTNPELYVSSTPIEAMTERCLWLNISPEEDALGRWLVWHGVQPSFLKMIITNPVVRLNNASGTSNVHLFDALPYSVDYREPADLLHALLTYQNRLTFQVVSMRSQGSVESHGVLPSQAFSVPSTCQSRIAHAVLTFNPILLPNSKDYSIVCSLLKQQLHEYGIQVLGAGSLSPEQADRRQVFSILHKRLFRYAMRVDAFELCASFFDEEKKFMNEILSTTNLNDNGIVDGNSKANGLMSVFNRDHVLNAMQFSDAHGITSKNLHTLWDCCSPVVHVAPDLYIGKVPSECRYIVNGFVPYCMDVSVLFPWTYFLVSFDESRVSYRTLLSKIIGNPYVKEAETGSLHAMLRESWCSLGLTRPPHPFMGAVHASSSALAALKHRLLLMVNPPSLKVDPLGYECITQHRLSPYFLRLASTDAVFPTQGSRFGGLVGKSTEDALGLLREVARDDDQTPVRNTALLVIKPHSLGRCVAQIVEETLKAWQVHIDEEGDVTGATAREIGLLRCLVPGVVAYAVCNPFDLVFAQDEQTAIQQVFRVSWDEMIMHGIVLNAYTALKRLGGLTAPQLLNSWMDPQRSRVVLRDGALEITELAEHGLYVLNAFIPSLKQSIESEHVLTHWYVVSWFEEDLSWDQFSLKIIGGEESRADTAPESIRGKVFSQWRALGLKSAPDRILNVVHASTDPWHGLLERLCVVQPYLEEDPLGDAILKSTVHPALVELWLADPELLVTAIANYISRSTEEGRTLPLELEMRDTSRLIYYMEEISAKVCAHIIHQREAESFESDEVNTLELYQICSHDVDKPQNFREDEGALVANNVISVFHCMIKDHDDANADGNSEVKIAKGFIPAVYTACETEERKRYIKMRKHLQMALNYAHSIRNL